MVLASAEVAGSVLDSLDGKLAAGAPDFHLDKVKKDTMRRVLKNVIGVPSPINGIIVRRYCRDWVTAKHKRGG